MTREKIDKVVQNMLLFYRRYSSRKFGLALIITLSGVLAAFVLPAVPWFVWLQPYSVAVFVATCGVVTAYITGNVLMDFINKKYGEKHREKTYVGEEAGLC